MKKYLIILLFLMIPFLTYSIEIELKLGVDIYRSLSVDAEGNRPTGIYPGGSVGMEALISKGNIFRYGVGMVWHNSANGKNNYEGHSTSPLYLVGKYEFNDDLYFISRGGWAFSKAGDTTGVRKTDGGLYGALGIGKQFKDEKVNIELIYEFMKYRYITRISTREDGYYQILSLVFSYKIGTSN